MFMFIAVCYYYRIEFIFCGCIILFLDIGIGTILLEIVCTKFYASVLLLMKTSLLFITTAGAYDLPKAVKERAISTDLRVPSTENRGRLYVLCLYSPVKQMLQLQILAISISDSRHEVHSKHHLKFCY